MILSLFCFSMCEIFGSTEVKTAFQLLLIKLFEAGVLDHKKIGYIDPKPYKKGAKKEKKKREGNDYITGDLFGSLKNRFVNIFDEGDVEM